MLKFLILNMPIYTYTGIRNGKKTRGVIEIGSKYEALQVLRKEGIIITEIKQETKHQETPKKGKIKLADISRRLKFSSISMRDIAIMSRQLASLLKAGMPLAESLGTITRQTRKNSMKILISKLSEGINSGKSFSQTLSENSNTFPEIYIGMVKTGESSGELDKVMEDLADYLEKQISLRSKITSAMIYPIFIVTVMGGVVWVLISFVVPKIGELLQDVGKTLPIYTKMLILFSKIFTNIFPYILILGVILFFWRKKILSIPKVRYYYDLARLKLPLISKIHTSSEIYRIFSTLSTLTKAGVPLVKAIETAESITTNTLIKNSLRQTKEAIAEGKSMSEKLSEFHFFPPSVYNLVAVGERSGEIEKMFKNISDSLLSELETFVSTITSLIEPILIVLIGGLIFLIMLSVIVPILEINRAIM